jgi:hypothetical protein
VVFVRTDVVTANVVPSSPILFTLMMEAIRSTETSILTRATRLHIPEDGILHGVIFFLGMVVSMTFIIDSNPVPYKKQKLPGA